MTGREIFKYLEEWAPRGVAWDKDNVGLQVGNPEAEIKNVILSLDLNQDVIDSAIKENCNLIITHHPLLYHPLKNLDFSKNKNAMMIERMIKNNITLYSAHTNLDFTKHGVSYQLADRLTLKKIRFLKNLSENQFKLSVFVPVDHINKVSDAMHQAGAGIIGEYSNCGFRKKGIGTFKGLKSSNPSRGKKGNLEFVEEVKLEMLVDKWKLQGVIDSMKKAHPYEEIAFDIFPLKNENVNYGIGAIGDLNKPMKQNEFLNFVSSKLKTTGIRYVSGKTQAIKTVAVCGGSCGELLEVVLKQKADAFITSDLKYHTFQEADGKILLIDAGHYETEVLILEEIKFRLETLFKKNKKIKVLKYKGSTNPIVFFNKSGVN